MSTIVKPFSFSAGATIVAAEHNSNFDTIYSDYNGNITNVNISASAAIAYSKLTLSGSIVNADINASAAIVDTKLAQITTASKVSGAAVTLLTSVPSGAGILPTANLGSGSASASTVLKGNSTWGVFTNIQIFTASGTFTVPTGITKVYLSIAGAGAGGGSGNTTGGATGGGGGGGGASLLNFPFTVTPAAALTVTIGASGAGGTGPSSTTNDGVDGGATSFDTVTVAGGIKGLKDNGNGGLGGSSTSGIVYPYDATAAISTGGQAAGVGVIRGGNGAKNVTSAGGGGGGTPFGAGTAGGANTVSATNAAVNTGAGGGGGGSGANGGNGGSGICVVMY